MVRHSVFAQHSILIAILVARNVQKANLGGAFRRTAVGTLKQETSNLLFFRQLSQNLWWLLENGGPPAPVEVPLTQPPDPYFEGVVLKAMTSLIQVCTVYASY